MTGKKTFEMCVAKIQEYEEKNFFKPKYLFINPITYKHLKDYVMEQGMFCIARGLGQRKEWHSTECYMGVEIIICELGDDEIIVGG